MGDINVFKSKLDTEIFKLIENKWNFLEKEWPFIHNRFNHRTEIKEIKNNNMKYIKDTLLNQLGYIPVFYFLTVLYGNKEYPGPYKEIDKGLLLIYHIISGVPGKDMHQFIPYSTFYELYKRFWIRNYTELNKIVRNDMKNLFTNTKIRILSAKANNPEGFKNVTLFLDGHDSKIKYYNPTESKKTLYSYKLQGKGVRTQVISDMNNMIVYVSDSEKCAIGNDGTMFLNMKLFKDFLQETDCIAFDGGYDLFIDKFINNAEDYNSANRFDKRNFVYPIRKEQNLPKTVVQLDYNKKFGSFRSGIENHFSVLASKFDRFNNNRTAVQTSDIKIYNLQFRVACLLKNIWEMCRKYNIDPQPHHMLWFNNDFEFPTKITKLNYIFKNEQLVNREYNEMLDIQDKFLDVNIEDMDVVDELEVDQLLVNDDINNKKKRKHNNKNKKENETYEVEKILDHMIDNNGKYVFYVKWKHYGVEDSTWVKEANFNTKDIISEYKKDKNI
jgi:hypothetical protein